MKAQSFNTGWTCSAYGKEFPVTLPHDCMVGSKRAQENATGPDIGFFEPVRATYRKTFQMAEVPPVALVRFDGVMGLCEVRLNDQKIGFHPYGYTAFCCDLKP